MSFLEDINFGDVVEPRAVPAGEEYRLRIVDIKVDENGNLPTDKNGNRYILPMFEIPDEVGAQNFSTFIGLPHGEMSPKQLNAAKFRLQQFLLCFDHDPDNPPSDPKDLVDSEGYAILGTREDEQYGEQNTIRKFIVKR